MIKTIFCCVLFLASFYCSAQKLNAALEIEKIFAKNKNKGVGSIHYKMGSNIQHYKNPYLERMIPEYSFFIFPLQQRDCYSYTNKSAIAIFKSDNFFQIQYGLSFLANDLGLNEKFSKIFTQLRFDNQTELEVFIENLAQMLFSTDYKSDYKLITKDSTKLVFESENSNLTFKTTNLSITTIDYKMKL